MVDHMAIDDEGIPQGGQVVYQLPGESLAAACKRLGVSYHAAKHRRKRGLPDEQVFAPHSLRYYLENDSAYALPGESLAATCKKAMPHKPNSSRARRCCSPAAVTISSNRRGSSLPMRARRNTEADRLCD